MYSQKELETVTWKHEKRKWSKVAPKRLDGGVMGGDRAAVFGDEKIRMEQAGTEGYFLRFPQKTSFDCYI